MNASHYNFVAIYVTFTSFKVFYFSSDADEFWSWSFCWHNFTLFCSFPILQVNSASTLSHQNLFKVIRPHIKKKFAKKAIRSFWKIAAIIVALRLKKTGFSVKKTRQSSFYARELFLTSFLHSYETCILIRLRNNFRSEGLEVSWFNRTRLICWLKLWLFEIRKLGFVFLLMLMRLNKEGLIRGYFKNRPNIKIYLNLKSFFQFV